MARDADIAAPSEAAGDPNAGAQEPIMGDAYLPEDEDRFPAPAPEPEPEDQARPAEEPEPSPEPPAQTEPEDQAEEFPEELLLESGLSEQEAREKFGSPEALDNAMNLWSRPAVNSARARLWQAQQTAPGPVAQQQQPPAPQQQAPPPQRQPQETDDLQYPLSFEDPDEWDPEVRKTLEGMNKWYSEKLRDIRYETGAMINSLLQQQQAQAGAREVQEFDEAINSLPEDFKSVYGEGYVSTLDPSSPQFARRADLAATVMSLREQRAQAGLPEASMKILVRRAAAALAPSIEKTAVRKQISKSISKRRGQFVSRPSARRKAPQSGVDAAIDAAKRWYADHGLPTTPGVQMNPDDGI